MINILIPLAGPNLFFKNAEYPYPKPLIEINHKTIIEHVINNYNDIKEEKKFIFIINSKDCHKHHLDNVLNLLTNNTCEIIKIDKETKGVACSAMMAINYINNDNPLIIANSDQLFDDKIEDLISSFKDFDGGVVTFASIHPRWSYAKVDDKNNILETAEKTPLSKHAIAGLFYFKQGKDFIKSAMSMIKKDTNIDDLYYISPTLNEMILQNKKLTIKEIKNNKYHTFYTLQKIKEYIKLNKC